MSKNCIDSFLRGNAHNFFERNWLTNPFHLSAGESNENPYLTVEEIDNYLCNGHLCYPLVASIASKTGRTLDAEALSYSEKRYPSSLINRKKLFQFFLEGNSIIINYAHLYFRNLKSLTNGLENEFNSPVHANIYITPSMSKGFAPHFDKHEVFVYQVHGTKKWYLYNKPYSNPGVKQQLTPDEVKFYETTKPAHTLVMHPGDILYVPKGVVHNAETENYDSIHVTFGVNHKREEEFMNSFSKSEAFKNDVVLKNLNQSEFIKSVKSRFNDVLDSRLKEFLALNQDEYFDSENLFTSIMMVNLITNKDDLQHFSLKTRNGANYDSNDIIHKDNIDVVKKQIMSEMLSGNIQLEVK